MSEHFVCRGSCAGTSDEPKACDTESCTMNGVAMESCNCTDDLHAKVVEEEPTEDREIV